ncbi:hypothetical protein TCAL_07849 [Tigriopus californicus]|uniref:Uncharacterized protein n=1 Tax=Tigriopus californicus TaxID=6832 RepID=A0A553PL64_TIGCA|nr:hypothetical protein TCAL_07849 [Tigriopus californicus]|eukprot:TCALIF_07849-PA protein Name:"Protein of unknown function" AED:0.42 eAED:0.42 QI:0/0/0.5/0.5/0/0.5/2/98/71
MVHKSNHQFKIMHHFHFVTKGTVVSSAKDDVGFVPGGLQSAWNTTGNPTSFRQRVATLINLSRKRASFSRG